MESVGGEIISLPRTARNQPLVEYSFPTFYTLLRAEEACRTQSNPAGSPPPGSRAARLSLALLVRASTEVVEHGIPGLLGDDADLAALLLEERAICGTERD